jgi:hypothetical protein
MSTPRLYRLTLTSHAERQFDKLPPDARARLAERLDRLRTDPRGQGVRTLSGPEGGYRINYGEQEAKDHVDAEKGVKAALATSDAVAFGRATTRRLAAPQDDVQLRTTGTQARATRGPRRTAHRGGLPTRVTPLSEKGDGSAFLPAPEAHSLLQQQTADDSVLREHRYFRVPSALWTKGHIAQLTGPGLAMLLALLSERRGNLDPGVWFSPARATARFGFAASTRVQGLAQLRELGLVRTTLRTVSEHGTYIDFARRRGVHEVLL